MNVVLNGRSVDTEAATLAQLIEEMGIAPVRVAVERNRELVPRRLWADTPLAADDAIEVVQMVGGGCCACDGCA